MLLLREMYVLFPCYVCPIFVTLPPGISPIAVNNNNNNKINILTRRDVARQRPPDEPLVSLLSCGYLVVKLSECEVGYLPPSIDEVTNTGSVPPLPIRLHSMVLD
jgi:hypothetical protein